jgi:crotonobetainyl-CoA:carnitine CoA-transferase CaiB-like acyl-CoA transferase
VTGEGALDGLRVLDITQVMAGSYCGLLLADMGADVIKIERPVIGDLTRWAGDGVNAFAPLNRNKRGIAVDYTKPDGAAVIRRLAAAADVVVENHRPGALAKYRLGDSDLRGDHPRLVYCSISGFGATGPLSGLGGFDLMAQGMAGLMSLTGVTGGDPCKVGVPIADLNAGVFATVGVLAALVRRGVTGHGQTVTTSLLESSVAYTLWESMMYFQAGHVAEPGGSAHRLAAPYEALPTQDGWITVAAPQPALFEQLCRAVGRPQLTTDERFASPQLRLANRAALADELAAELRTRPTAFWVQVLADAGVPSGPVHTIDEVFDDPQVLATGMVEGEGRDRRLGHPVKMSETPWSVDKPAPKLGEHTRSVLAEHGYDDETIDALFAHGAVA